MRPIRDAVTLRTGAAERSHTVMTLLGLWRVSMRGHGQLVETDESHAYPTRFSVYVQVGDRQESVT